MMSIESVAGRTLYRQMTARRAQLRSLADRALLLRRAPAVGETIFLQMSNSLLDFTFDLAAEVRHATPHTRGTWLVGLGFDRSLSLAELAALI